MSIKEAYGASAYADSIGVLQQKTLLENSFRAVRQSATASKPPKVLQQISMSRKHNCSCHVQCNWLTSLRALSQVKGLTPATRQSQRLQKVDAENVGLVNFPDDIELRQGEKSGSQAEVKSCQIPGLKTYRLFTSEMPRRSRAAELP